MQTNRNTSEDQFFAQERQRKRNAVLAALATFFAVGGATLYGVLQMTAV